jgi:hypothetical protein
MKSPAERGFLLSTCRRAGPRRRQGRTTGRGIGKRVPRRVQPAVLAGCGAAGVVGHAGAGVSTHCIARCRSGRGRSRRRAACCRATRGRTSACRAASGLRKRVSARECQRCRQSQCCEFHDCSFFLPRNGQRGPPSCVPAGRSQFVAVPSKVSTGRKSGIAAMLWKGRTGVGRRYFTPRHN